MGRIMAGTAVNVRQSPDPSSKTVGAVSPNHMFRFSEIGEWYKFEGGIHAGHYISKKFVVVYEPQLVVGEVINGPVRVRATPSKSGAVVASLLSGELLDLKMSGEWPQIVGGLYDGKFVSSQFIELVDLTSSATTKPVVSPLPAALPMAKPIPPVSPHGESNLGTIIGRDIRIREAPNKSAKIRSYVQDGEIFALTVDGDWGKITKGPFAGSYMFWLIPKRT